MNNADNKNNRISPQKTNLPTLSVIVPNYNHAQYVGQALKAMLEQPVKPLELVVIDDASADNSVEVIRRFVEKDPIVHLVQNEQNNGNIVSTNRHLHRADNEWIKSILSNGADIYWTQIATGYQCLKTMTAVLTKRTV